MKPQITLLLESAANQLKSEGVIPQDHAVRVSVDNTRDKAHGDLATNLAMTLAKPCKSNPRAIAEKIIAAIPDNQLIEKIEIAGPGFINFYLSGASNAEVVAQILEDGAQFGWNINAAGKKVQVEFVSANPTGPLHVGHGRNAALGDSLCRIMEANGWEPTREFYYNDAGAQIDNLALSVQLRCKGLTPDDEGWPEDGYRGEYIIDIAKAYMAGETVHADDKEATGAKDVDNLNAIREFAVAYLRHEQDLDLKAFDVDFDIYFLESSLYSGGLVEQTVKQLTDNGYTYENDGAMWLKTTEFGDDKDRVMRKKDGGYTYFLPDVAYHKNKFERGFDRVINVQGADHHSTVTRVRAGLQALNEGIPQGFPDYALYQMILVTRGGEEVKLSKRAGSYLTLRDLIEEVGRDATRYFLISRSCGAQITFDIDLARSKSNENPVYYIQYAHARIHGMLSKLAESDLTFDQKAGLAALSNLELDAERELITQLRRFPDVVVSAADSLEPSMVATYLKDLAGLFHSYYNSNKMLVEEDDIRNARLALSKAVAQVIASGLHLLGVSAPESM
ncbi:arginine--tRNA ligase [Reinekea marinisedimentorum]|uniref:Arginine--tRNA ligase n=1 Tax=Reinekea marinisedimentorum TaxID=230495 RepID=A0A4R3IA86_9GAMM|nr:arginine--tRNA ligase [Reinekea marinisedimentorum]TCS43200.1 arginyl-tRNA synthetase [Reinekea marinisedimentorum]